MKNKRKKWFIGLNLVFLLPSAALSADKAVIGLSQQKVLRDQIFNSVCCVPNMSSGYSPRKMKDGAFNSKENDCQIAISLEHVTFGELDNKPVAVALLYDNEGGSGTFESLMLYDVRGGKATIVGSYPVGDRAIVKSLTIGNDGVRLVSEESIGAEKGKRKSVLIKRSKFDPVECVQYDLSKETKDDIAKLTDLYMTAFGEKPFTADQKAEALAICNRHQNEAAKFAQEFRLGMNAAGWGVGEHPLTYQEGKPIFHEEDWRKNSYRSLELSK